MVSFYCSCDAVIGRADNVAVPVVECANCFEMWYVPLEPVTEKGLTVDILFYRRAKIDMQPSYIYDKIMYQLSILYGLRHALFPVSA